MELPCILFAVYNLRMKYSISDHCAAAWAQMKWNAWGASKNAKYALKFDKMCMVNWLCLFKMLLKIFDP